MADLPLLETLAAGTGLETSLQNDASACATAERMGGAADGLDHVVCLYLGYGIGAGFILGGELYSGSNRNAGELGMVLFSRGGSVQPLEHRASLASLFQSLGLDSATTDAYDAVERLAAQDDPRIRAWLAGAAADFRQAVHMVETLFDPQTVILTGSAPQPLALRLFEAIFPCCLPMPSGRAGPCPASSSERWIPGPSRSALPPSRSAGPSIRFSRRS